MSSAGAAFLPQEAASFLPRAIAPHALNHTQQFTILHHTTAQCRKAADDRLHVPGGCA